MAEVTAGMVKELRERTGLGMMECKRALEEAKGDMKAAEDLLRIKSGAKASKAAGRVAAEGVVGAWLAPDGRQAAMVEVNSETDFVAKSDDFTAFARALAALVGRHGAADAIALAALPFDGGTVESARQALVQKIGENVSIRRLSRMSTDARLVQYLHGGGKIGVTVEIEGGDEQVGKDIAMHIAAMKPLCVSRDQVPAQSVAREREIAAARAAESGKPANIVEKMVEGAVAKYLAEVSLLGQPFVRDDKVTVEKHLAAKGAKVRAFTMFVVGEGIERKQSDFAAEVAAMAKGS
jgi:elongation factor Ts